jgi:hypothetical protein
MPTSSGRDVVPSEAALVSAGMALFQKVGGPAALPCTRLGLCATRFVEQPAASILSFLGGAKPAAASAPAAAKEKEDRAAVAAATAVEPVVVVGLEEVEGAMRPCAKCGGKPIPHEEWAEHTDWHVAMELQRVYGGGDGSGGGGCGAVGSSNNNSKRPGPTGQSSGRPTKNKKGSSSSSSSTNNNRGPKAQTLDKFWTKKK